MPTLLSTKLDASKRPIVVLVGSSLPQANHSSGSPPLALSSHAGKSLADHWCV